MENKKTIILGAGFTGLAAGIKTGAPVYETSDHAGGICTSYLKDGFHFSHGGPHFLFGKGQGLDYIKSLVPVNEYERRASIYFNKFFPYPIQTVAQQTAISHAGTLKAWLTLNFSRAENNLFFYPFNEKYTAGLYDEVIQYDAFKTPPAGSVGFVPTFGDPVGGLTAVVNKMEEKCNIHFNKRAVRINPISKSILFEDNEVIWYDKLISTIPMDQLLTLCGKTDFDLPYTSVLVLNIGAEPDINTPTDHWVYVPFCKTNFHRACFYSNVDSSKAPKSRVGLAVEIAFPSGINYEDLDINSIIQSVTEELQSWHWIGKVITVDPTWVKCAYTWLRSIEHRDEQLAWLKERDIISTGRYGKWHFQGMVDSIKDGFEVEI